ncbi:MAG: 50S ribosomal protein L25 [Bryobacteraceae bacterium]
MRKDITIVAEPRAARGKNEARRLRTRGLIPAVVYGVGQDPVAVAVSPKEMERILLSTSGHNTIFNLNTNAKASEPVLIADWQHDPIKGSLLHVDLRRVDLAKPISVKVPVHLEGDPRGVKQQGGLMEVVTREIEIHCLPDDIPAHFLIDVSEMLIGQSLRASEVPLSGSMKLLSPPETVIAHVVAIRTSETVAAAEEAAAEPEVVKKGKKEEEAKKK